MFLLRPGFLSTSNPSDKSDGNSSFSQVHNTDRKKVGFILPSDLSGGFYYTPIKKGRITGPVQCNGPFTGRMK